ncbi:hypothetical protein JCM10908_001827 [Rhodotorula pacifica]|uniref:uncharacterized protein n=1 Tax=Rhodotorula pacifica TaxID=1495444 RepID=UPI00316E978A
MDLEKFVRQPPSCLPRRATRVAQSSSSSSSALVPSGALPVTAKAPASNVRVPGVSAGLPTASGHRFDAIVAAAPHSQLIALGLVVALVSSGLLIARLRKGAPKTTGSKASRKQKDNALRKIMQAQTAAASTTGTSDDLSSSSPAPAGATTSSAVPAASPTLGAGRAGTSATAKANGTAVTASSSSTDASRRPVLSRVNTAVGGSIAAAAELVPSPACVTSSSAVIWNGLERIGHVLSATASRAARSGSNTASPSISSKGKEREVDRFGDEDGVSSSHMRRKDSMRSGSHTPPIASDSAAAGRKGKGKKGKTPTSSQMSPASSAQGFTSALASPVISRRPSEKGGTPNRSSRNEVGVQTFSSLPGDFPSEGQRNYALQLEEEVAPIQPPARLEKPPDPPPPAVAPPKRTLDAFVQTSPRLLPLPASPPLPASDISESSAPSAARSMSPLRPFDLHASFQATTTLPPTEPLLSLDNYSVTNPTTYKGGPSPHISPSMTRLPSASGATESIASSSPTSRRASSPMLESPPITHARPVSPAFERRSSAVSVNGHLAVSTPERVSASASGTSSPALAATRSRKAARKASANEVAHVGQQGVVGLPGAVAAPRRSSEAEKAERTRSTKSGKSPKSDERPGPPVRRSSATSSGASANSKGADAARSNGLDDLDSHQQRWPVSGDRMYGYAALGIRNDEDDDLPSEGGSELDRRSSSAAGEGYLPAGFTSSRSGHFMSPDTSPHPSQRSLSSSHYTPSNHRTTPWSPHLASQYAPVMGSPSAHSISRPPSRGSSLSVPVAMTPMSAAGATQQQQAFALAQSQLQTQSQIMLHYQQMQAVQQRQSQSSSHVPPLRRRATSGGLSETSDGLLSPTATATPAMPNGFSYPFNAVTSPLLSSSTHGWTSHSSGLTPQMVSYGNGPPSPYPVLSQSSSPTTVSFPNGAYSPQIPSHAVLAHPNAMYPSSSVGAGYLASPTGPTSYGQMQPSPTHAYFSAIPPPPQQRKNSLPYPARPRLSSSMSAGTTHANGGGAKGSNSAGSNNQKSRGHAERSQTIPSAPLSGGVPLGDPPPSGWKGKLKQAELEADRMGKELEIARWRLAVVEEEQRAAERESQDALKALAARAMRAEARIKLFEATAGRNEGAEEAPASRVETRNGTSTPSDGSPPMRAASAVPKDSAADEPPAAHLPKSTDILPKLQLNGSTSADELSESPPDKPTHPLAWLDLDAVSFGNSRPLRQTSPSLAQSSPRLAASRRRNGRASHSAVEANRRRPNPGPRRKSALNVQAPPAAEAEMSDDEEIVIVLDAPLRRRPVPRVIPSRRSSFVDDDGLDRDGNSICDDEDVPVIDIDDNAESLAGGIVVGDGEEGIHEHPAYIGFLPAYLTGSRSTPTAAILPTKSLTDATSLEVEHAELESTVSPSEPLGSPLPPPICV